MLNHVLIPVHEIAGMKPTHIAVLIGLKSFADRTGRCWPTLRTLAHAIGMTLSRVQRAVEEMVEAEDLKRRKRPGRSCVYQLAARFLGLSRQQDSKAPAPPPRSTDSPATPSPAGRTEGESGKEDQLDSREEAKPAAVRRFAPPPVTHTGPNPFARKAWLRTVHAFVGERLKGSVQWTGFELVAAAQAGTLTRSQQRDLDWIDKQMRACGFRPAAG